MGAHLPCRVSLCVFGILLLLRLTKSIRLTRTEVPNYGILNREAVLGCEFDLENDTLYSVKWYKDGHEFFRYRRDMERPMIIFPLSGVTVNVNRSSESQVSLEPVTLLSRGTYRCEVSADAPSFQTVYEDRCMDVLVPPRKGPEISGVYPWYNIGDNLTAKCTVEKTYPEPRISWFVNDVQFDPGTCECISTEMSQKGKAIDGTIFYSGKSQLEFQLDTPYFRDGGLAVECKITYRKSPLVLKANAMSKIKTGFGRHYANIVSSAPVFVECSVVLVLLVLLVLKNNYCRDHA